MDAKEISLLIEQLRKENETNSPEEKAFNLNWIELLKTSMDNALSKKDYELNKQKRLQRMRCR